MVGVFVAQLKDGSVRVAVTGAGPKVFRVPEMEAALDEEFFGRCDLRASRSSAKASTATSMPRPNTAPIS